VRSRWASTDAAALLAAGLLACGEPPVVNDAAGLLGPVAADAIELQHRYLRADHGIDYRVETVRDAPDLDRLAVARFEELRVGTAGRGGRGLLLLVDAERDEVRLEVGRALEGTYTDAFVAYIQQRQMVPFFRAGQIGDGILAATELIVARAHEGRDGIADLGVEGSGGGGARTRAGLGAGPDDTFRRGAEVAAGDTPEAAVDAYFAAMRDRNGRADLELYSAATRRFLAGRVLTGAQMDNLVRAYRDCRAEPSRAAPDGARAVVRYAVEDRACAPWLLVREDGSWRIDLAAASHAFRFGRDNGWHLSAAGALGPYAFAFEDWRFDARGYPR
jgi:uncharacterized protein